MITVGFICE